MNLHNEIMNIPIPNDFDYADFHSKVYAYKSGHRDARHVAAELSLKYESLIEKLLDFIDVSGNGEYSDDIRKEYGI